MKKLLIAIAALALLVFAAAAVAGTGRGSEDGTSTRTTSDDGRDDDRRHGRGRGGHDWGRDDDRREAGEDVRGPCDESEHTHDARCAGARRSTNRSATVQTASASNTSAATGTVRVIERSYSISFSPKPRAGRTTFVVGNASDDDHDFWLAGGGKTTGTRKLAGGGVQRLIVTLKQGVRYRFFCAVGSHAQAGMSGTFVAR